MSRSASKDVKVIAEEGKEEVKMECCCEPLSERINKLIDKYSRSCPTYRMAPISPRICCCDSGPFYRNNMSSRPRRLYVYDDLKPTRYCDPVISDFASRMCSAPIHCPATCPPPPARTSPYSPYYSYTVPSLSRDYDSFSPGRRPKNVVSIHPRRIEKPVSVDESRSGPEKSCCCTSVNDECNVCRWRGSAPLHDATTVGAGDRCSGRSPGPCKLDEDGLSNDMKHSTESQS